MANAEHVKTLEAGVEVWNGWREANPTIKPDLAGADLSETDLCGANLAEASMLGVDLCEAKLVGANLKMANLTDADCSGADLSGIDGYKADFSSAFLTQAKLSSAYLAGVMFDGADLRGSGFDGANLSESSLRGVNCTEADFSNADLSSAVVVDANLSSANFAGTNLYALSYGSYRDMRGRYLGIRGLESCFGNALFVRDAKDQDYLDTLERGLKQTQPPWTRWTGLTLFRLWGLIDYGRSFGKPTAYALILAGLFGGLYACDMAFGWGLIDYSGVEKGWLTPFYFSVVTYTTLGYGDIAPKTPLGQAVVIGEVILGYLTLGLLLSILANKVARRA